MKVPRGEILYSICALATYVIAYNFYRTTTTTTAMWKSGKTVRGKNAATPSDKKGRSSGRNNQSVGFLPVFFFFVDEILLCECVKTNQ